jgi:hypothetical protein
VATAVETRLLRRWGQRLQPRDADHSQRRRDLLRAEPQLLDAVGEVDHVEHVALDVEITGDVRTTEAELTGRGDDAPQCVR